MRKVKELVNIICFLCQSFGVACWAVLVTGKDLDAKEDYTKQIEKMTILLMLAHFFKLSLKSLHNELKNDVSMMTGIEFMNEAM